MATATDPHPTSIPIPEEELASEEEMMEDEEEHQSHFLWYQAAPAWLVSTLVHVLILLILGLITIADPTKIVNVLSAVTSTDDGPEMEEFTIEQVDPGEVEESEEMPEPMIDTPEPMEMIEPQPMEPMEIATVPLDMSDFAAQMAPTAATLATLTSMSSSQPMSSRTAETKKKLLREYGGTASSEAAVTEALKWFSRHQMPNGGWTYQHELVCKGACGDGCDPKFAKSLNGATSMALLPFMGAGQTHFTGEFKNVVRRGLLFLIQNGKPGNQGGLPVLDFRDAAGNMYSHGLATITLCEAYAMTEDPALAGPAQAAINYVIYAQGKDGGWRYGPRSPEGDTSVVGWQVMGLKSAHMGHLMVPPQVIKGSVLFLDKVQSNNGAIYGYTAPSTSFRPATTAVGLLCRMYLGWDKTHPGIIKGVEGLSKHGVSKTNLYYDYYAAQVLRQYGGEKWDKFNVELRDYLVAQQDQRPGYKGSWFIKGGGHSSAAGRLCSTSFATMILEVYYRHMPLYAQEASEDDFPL